MTQTRLFILFFSLNICHWGQQLVQNFGYIQLQNQGLVGFQNGFIYYGGNYVNLEFIRFYNNAEFLFTSRAFSPTYFHFETAGNNQNVDTRISENVFYEGVVGIAIIYKPAAVERQKIFNNNPKKSYSVKL